MCSYRCSHIRKTTRLKAVFDHASFDILVPFSFCYIYYLVVGTPRRWEWKNDAYTPDVSEQIEYLRRQEGFESVLCN